jgi:hypothetical protein
VYGGQTSGRDTCYLIYNTNDIAVQPMQLAAIGPVNLLSAPDAPAMCDRAIDVGSLKRMDVCRENAERVAGGMSSPAA